MSTKIKIKHGWNYFRFYLSFLLLGLYLVVGILFLFTNTWADLLPQGRTSVGLVLILYGAMRFFIAYRRYSNKKTKIQIKKQEKENVTAE